MLSLVKRSTWVIFLGSLIKVRSWSYQNWWLQNLLWTGRRILHIIYKSTSKSFVPSQENCSVYSVVYDCRNRNDIMHMWREEGQGSRERVTIELFILKWDRWKWWTAPNLILQSYFTCFSFVAIQNLVCIKFQNIQSTNWQTMRFKPPPPSAPIGWRVEFRPTEVMSHIF